MQVTMLKGKIHRCTVTQGEVDYEGSVTISAELMEAANIAEHEQVHIWNVSSGERLVTYAMLGRRDSGMICMNGAAAHIMMPGDFVIIAAFVSLTEAEAREWTPRESNSFTSLSRASGPSTRRRTDDIMSSLRTGDLR